MTCGAFANRLLRTGQNIRHTCGRFPVAWQLRQQQRLKSRGDPVHAVEESSFTDFKPRQHDVLSQEVDAGSLHIIMGPMFAGKTSALLQKVEEAEKACRRVSIVTNKKDTRYAVNKCVSHDGVARDSVAVTTLMDLIHGTVADWSIDSVDVIAIDESQFFPDLPEFCRQAVDLHGKAVIAAGLSGDFKQAIFGDLVQLVPYADKVDFLTARCAFCEQNAPFTLRLVASDNQELVGGTEAYQPVCRRHYKALSKVKPDMS